MMILKRLGDIEQPAGAAGTESRVMVVVVSQNWG